MDMLASDSPSAGNLIIRGAHVPWMSPGPMSPGQMSSGQMPPAHLAHGSSDLVDIVIHRGLVRSVEPSSSGTLRTAPSGLGSKDVIDAGGRIALPGFIDAHSHAAAAVFDPQVQLALLRQGVTSIVVGQDGIGSAPSTSESFQWAARYFAGIDGRHPHFSGGSMAQLLASYQHSTAINVAALVPHGSLRYTVMGPSTDQASPKQTRAMVDLARQAMNQGAVGISTGLEYVPAMWAHRQELVALATAVAGYGLPHVSHMRGYEAQAATAIAELMQIAQASGVATHISHLHGPGKELLAEVNKWIHLGYDLTFDSYPYLRGCSIVSLVALPHWLPVADSQATLALLEDGSVRERVIEHIEALAGSWEGTSLAWVPGLDPGTGQALDWVQGRSVVEVAGLMGVSIGQAVLRILTASQLRASCVFAQPATNSGESVMLLSRHHAHMVGSDAIFAPWLEGESGHPHPRAWGAFARYLTACLPGRGLRVDTADGSLDGADPAGTWWSWKQAIEHLSARAARRFRLSGRGHVLPGASGDVVLVDTHTLQDHATYALPRALATGIEDVCVAGVRVLSQGKLTGAQPGQALRPSAV